MKSRKKRFNEVIIVILIPSVVLFVLLYYNFTEPFGAEIFEKPYVDNSYNNYICGGDLCRVENKLFFHFQRNTFNYGLVEISPNGAHRIDWNGPMFFSPMVFTYPLYGYEKSVFYMKESNLVGYNVETKEFVNMGIELNKY